MSVNLLLVTTNYPRLTTSNLRLTTLIPTPRALETPEIAQLVEQFRHPAEMAKLTGFDGVQIQGANGYIIDQFLRDGSNQRTDQYGGSVEKRMRLLNEILDAIASIWPAERVGVRLTPENSFNSMSDSHPQQHFGYFIEQLSTRQLGCLHILQGDMMTKLSLFDYRGLRDKFPDSYMPITVMTCKKRRKHWIMAM